MKCDLHIHSNCSDGDFTVCQIVDVAKEKGLKVIAITDHDTVAGVKLAQEYADSSIKVLTGIEISTVYDNNEVHMLGYNLDIDTESFNSEIKAITEFRNNRNKALVEKLNANGFEISLADIQTKTQGSVGRPDIAKALVAKGYCKTVQEAFEKFIGKSCKYYVQTKRLTPQEAVEFIHRHNGVAVLAHPKSLHLHGKKFTDFVDMLKDHKLDGIESEYFTHTKSERKYYIKVAKERGLIITGGSDFHGTSHGLPIGKRHFSPSNYTKKVLKISEKTI